MTDEPFDRGALLSCALGLIVEATFVLLVVVYLANR